MEQILGRKIAERIYSGPPGDGTSSDPFIVHDRETLIRIGKGEGVTDPEDVSFGWTLDAHYQQVSNITLIADWEPIGTPGTPFTGSYDGQNYKIDNMKIYTPYANYIGMFGTIDSPHPVRRIRLSVNIVGNEYVGGITGLNSYNPVGSIEDCNVTGIIIGTGTISGECTGGIAGLNYNEISNCHVTGAAITGYYNIGGIAGENSGKITGSSFSGAAGIAEGIDNIGGIAGQNKGSIEYCRTTANVKGDSEVGGITGRNFHASSIVEYCYVTGATVDGIEYIGGIAGVNNGVIEKCYSAVNVFDSSNSIGASNFGGIAGNNNYTVNNCYATGEIGGYNVAHVGGIAGYNTGVVEYCYTTGDISGTNFIGGIAGQNYGTGRNCVVLSKTLIAVSDLGRVFGFTSNPQTNNYARYNINDDTNWPDDHRNGTDLDEDYQEDIQSFWEDTGKWTVPWSFSTIWDWGIFKLPILKNLPSGPQNPFIP